MGINIDDLKRTISVLRVLFMLLSIRWDLRISSYIHSTSVGILVVSSVGATYRRVMDFRQISFVGEGNYEGRTHNPISHVPNIGELDIVIHSRGGFVSAFERITWTSPLNEGLEESL